MRSLLLVALPLLSPPARTLAFRPPGPSSSRGTACGSPSRLTADVESASVSGTTSDGDDAPSTASVKTRSGPSPSGACYYRRVDGPWRPRKELRDLKIVSLTPRPQHSDALTYEHRDEPDTLTLMNTHGQSQGRTIVCVEDTLERSLEREDG